jgi:hypothetical protein
MYFHGALDVNKGRNVDHGSQARFMLRSEQRMKQLTFNQDPLEGADRQPRVARALHVVGAYVAVDFYSLHGLAQGEACIYKPMDPQRCSATTRSWPYFHHGVLSILFPIWLDPVRRINLLVRPQ